MEVFRHNNYKIDIKSEKEFALLRVTNIETNEKYMGISNMGFGVGSQLYANIISELKKDDNCLNLTVKITFADNLHENILILQINNFTYNLYTSQFTLEHIFLEQDNKNLEQKIINLEQQITNLEDKLQKLIEKIEIITY